MPLFMVFDPPCAAIQFLQLKWAIRHSLPQVSNSQNSLNVYILKARALFIYFFSLEQEYLFFYFWSI